MAGPADKAKILEQVQKFLQKGNVDKAIRAFGELLEIDPRDHRVRLRLADLLAKTGKRKEAVDHYEKVAATYIKDDFVPKAIAVYKTVTRLDPERLDLLEKLADLYKSQGLEGEAATQLQQLYEAYTRAQNEEGQVRVLRRMVDADPENLGVQVRLGETLARMGRKQEAAEAFARAATTLSRRGFHDRASSLFERIIALNPRNTSVRKELCAHYLEAGQFQEARREVEAILGLEPDDPRMCLLLGRILFKLDERDSAKSSIARSLDLFAAGGELAGVLREYLFVAQTYLRLGDIDEAETFYREISRVAPGEVGVLKGLVAVAEAKKDENARQSALERLGRAQAERGERKAASETFHRLLQADPLNQAANEYLAGPGGDEDLSPLMVGDLGEGHGEEGGPPPPVPGMKGAAAGQEEGEVSLEEIEGLGDIESLIPASIPGGEEPSLELDLLEEGGEPSAVEPPPAAAPLAPSVPPTGPSTGAMEGEEELPDLIFEEPEGFVIERTEHPQEASGEAVPSPTPPPPAEPPPAPPARPAPQPAAPAPPARLAGTRDELLVEADLYSRYGLWDKAMDIFNGLLVRNPRDTGVLDALYKAQVETGATEAPATGKRLVTSLLESGRGEEAKRAFLALRSDFPVSPEAADLGGLFPGSAAEAAEEAPPSPAAEAASPAPPGPPPAPGQGDPFQEDLEEADFYVTQGLAEEAVRIFQSILLRSPGHPVAAANLRELRGAQAPPAGTQPPPAAPTAPAAAPSAPPVAPSARPPAVPPGPSLRSKLVVEDAAPDTSDYLDIAEDLRSELGEEIEEKKPAPEEGHVTFEEIFAEFKKGIAATLGEQEYETHYNLGIAYKDMGLHDDAIRELKIASRDPKLFHDSLSLMAMCFLETGDLSSAHASVETALAQVPEQHRTGLTFQLGQVQERERDWEGALASYTEVRKRDPRFTGIDESIGRVSEALKAGRKKKPTEASNEDSQFENLFADLIREVGDLAEETRRQKDGEGPDPTPPAPGKKQRISYL